jgi:hypothetical protein
LADRGFLVSEELAAHGVTLMMSSFTRGKQQLSAMPHPFEIKLTAPDGVIDAKYLMVLLCL